MISMVSQNGSTQYGVCDFVVDNVKDLDELANKNLKMGSTAFCIGNNSKYILNGENKWKIQNSNSGAVSPEEIAQSVQEYFAANPEAIVTNDELKTQLESYTETNKLADWIKKNINIPEAYDDSALVEKVNKIVSYNKSTMEADLKTDKFVINNMTPYYDEEMNIFFALGHPILINKDASGDKAIKISWIGGEKVFPDGSKINVLGGGNSISVPLHFPHTKITMNSGYVHNIMGGNNAGGTVDIAEIIVNGGIINDINGAGAAWSDYYQKMYPNTVYNVKIIINDGIVKTSLYCGGCGADSNVETKAELIINDGTFNYVITAGSNGNTNAASIKVNGGNIQILQATNRGTVGDVEYNITGGIIEKAYLGGETASDVSGTINSINCNISGGTITNLYFGTDGSTAKDSTHEYVERKINVSKISGSYIDGVIKTAEDGVLNVLTKK